MIEWLRLENFKRHAQTELQLSSLTVLVGPNGSGKTSVLEALHFVSQLYSKSFDDVFRGPRSPEAIARHAPGVAQFAIEARGGSGDQKRGLRLVADLVPTEFEHDGEWHESEDWRASITVQPNRFGARSEEPLEGRSLREMGHVDHWPDLRSAVLLRLDARRVSAPSVAHERPRVEFDGSNVATVLANMKLGDEPRFEQICAHLRQVVPQFRSLRVLPTAVYNGTDKRESGFGLSFEMDSGPDIAASQLSEGTLLTLALLTALHARSRPRLLLLDDVHEALHPKAQARLMKLLLELVAGRDPLQIIATTHSPYIVDCMEPEMVVAFAQRPDGTSAVRLLSEHPEASRYRGRLSAGQLWTLDDEQDWVLEARQ